MVPGVWADFLLVLACILLLFGFGERLMAECGIRKWGCLLLLTGVMLGDVWRIERFGFQLSIFPLFLPLYLGIVCLGRRWQNVVFSSSISLILSFMYILWFLFVPLQPDFHAINHEGFVGIWLGILAACLTRRRVIGFGAISIGLLIGTWLRSLLNEYYLGGVSITSILDGEMRDEYVTALFVAAVLFEVRILLEFVASALKRKWRSTNWEGDVT